MATPQPQVLPKELRLSAPPTMPQARSYLFKQQATTAGAAVPSGGTITINLPRLQRSYLTKDSYIRFKLNVGFQPGTYANAHFGTCPANFVALDQPGAFGLINKLEVFDYLGSTLLESTDGHGQLAALLMDCHTSNEDRRTNQITQGTRSGNVTYEPFAGAPGHTNLGGSSWLYPETDPYHITQDLMQGPPTCGEILWNQAHGEGTVVYKTREYAIPVFSFLGLLSDKFAPLHNGYTIVLTLNTSENALIFSHLNPDLSVDGTSGAPQSPDTYCDFTVSDIYYECQILELGPVAESMLLSSTQGQPLVVPSKAYRHYIGSIPDSCSNYRLDINLNVASLTNILWFMRSTEVFKNWKPTLSARIRNFLQSWYFQYGSSVLPQTSGIKCRTNGEATVDVVQHGSGSTEAFNELMKARHALNDPYSNHTFDTYTYNKDQEGSQITPSPANESCYPGKFACGLDLELVSGKSQEIISGLNTNGMNTSIDLTFDSTRTGDVRPAVLDFYAEYDSFINIAPGLATTVSF